MIENMEKTSALESSSAELTQQANAFRVNARRTRRKMWWQDFKMKLAIGGGCFLFVLILMWSWGWFGGGDEQRRRLLQYMLPKA